MRQLCIPTDFQQGFLDALKIYKLDEAIYELYGSLSPSIIGSGRPESKLPRIQPQQFKTHVEAAHRLGIKFDYCLNASCLGNNEYKRRYYDKIIEVIEWLVEIGVDSVTVAMPYLAELIKRRKYPLTIKVSTIAQVNSVERAKFWESIGADVIILDFMQNRNFNLIRGLNKITKCILEVVLNDQCIYRCPYQNSCHNFAAHGLPSSSRFSQLYPYHIIKCTLLKLTDLPQLIKSRWIRPENLKEYKVAGIDLFKISGRGFPQEKILKWIKSYEQENYEGNLLEIVPCPVSFSHLGLDFTLSEIVYIDNKRLSGFVDFFQTNICKENCYPCNYCDKISKELMLIERGKLQTIISVLEKSVMPFFFL